MRNKVACTALMIASLSLVGLSGCRYEPQAVSSTAAETQIAEQSLDPEAPPAKFQFEGLGEDKQKQIWDLEHFTFELEQKFGKSVTAALQQRDREVLAGFFQDSFAGSVLAAVELDEADTSWWSTRVQSRAVTSEASDGEPADRDALVEYLIAALADFEEIAAAKMRVLSIKPEDAGSDQWRLQILLTASGSHEGGGPISLESHHDVTCRFANDEQIEAGQIITGWRVLDETLRTAPAKFLHEVTEQVGLANLGLTDNWTTPALASQYLFQFAVDDFNRDGYPDIAISCIEGRQDVLLSVDGTSFRNATLDVGIPPIQSRHGTYLACWLDFDNDGYSDLLLGESLYRNVGGQRLEDVTAESGLKIRDHSMGCVVADYDCDGRLDMYVLYQGLGSNNSGRKPSYVDDDVSGSPNQLWRNLGGGRFEDVTDKMQVGGGKRHSFAAVWMHANDDLLPDLYVANDFGTNLLFINRGDHFEDVSAEAAVGDFATSMGVASGDIDGDARPEIYVANMYSKMGRRIIEHVSEADYPEGLYAQIKGSCAGNRIYHQASAGVTYEERSVALGVNDVGWAYAPALVDLDGDGFLDIYATTGFLSFDRKKPDG